MIPPKIQTWLDNDYFPQRLLLSGSGNLIELAIELAGKIQKKSPEKLEQGTCGDTQIFRDTGTSFKIGKSDNPDPDTVRGMISWISQKPVAPHRVIILENFERLSREAPQAILKILEEPPAKAVFIFTTKNHYQILETILSRMTVMTVVDPQVTHEIPESLKSQDFFQENIFQQFFEKEKIIENFQFIENMDKYIKKKKNKKILWDFLSAISFYTKQNSPKFLSLVWETERYLRGNGNVKLGLERLVMKII